MKSIVSSIILILLSCISYAQELQRISGRVTQMGQPLSNVNILIEETGEGTFTNSSGFYKIETRPGSTVYFTYAGLRTVKIIVEDVTKILNIEMEPKYEQLDEVTVLKRKKLNSQQQLAKNYPFDKGIIKTTFGFSNSKTSGWRIISIDEDVIRTRGGLNLVSILEGSFLGSIDKSDPLNPKFYGRTTPLAIQVPMIFDVDGQVFTNFPIHIINDEIERIAIYPGGAVANIYGMRARGGVIVINTKYANKVMEKDSKKPYDYEKLRENYYVDDTTKVATAVLPDYINKMLTANSEEEAILVYEGQNSVYNSLPFYHLQASNYFFKKYGNKQLAIDILDKVSANFSDNPVVLKAVAYEYDVLGKLEKSWETYRKILLLRSDYAQSYRDIANSFRRLGNFRSALNMYSRYGIFNEISDRFGMSSAIDSIMRSEYTNLIAIEDDPIFEKKKDDVKNEKWGARVLVEWNNSEAEFELQVIHPNSQFFIIDHTISSNPKRIEDEKIKGHSSEQIFFDVSSKGKWNINLRYLGNKSYDPTYFKITLFKNWGLPNQSEEIKVYPISEKNSKKNILRFEVLEDI